MDIYMHDDDNGTAEGTVALSPFNTDHGWQYPTEWTYSWLGNKTSTGIDNRHNNIITDYRLDQNYPNPFNPTTTIRYSLAKQGDVSIVVYNILGQQVAKLVNAKQIPGEHNVQWNAGNLPSGMYFYTIKAGNYSQTRKMILMK